MPGKAAREIAGDDARFRRRGDCYGNPGGHFEAGIIERLDVDFPKASRPFASRAQLEGAREKFPAAFERYEPFVGGSQRGFEAHRDADGDQGARQVDRSPRE
jgi:hypothetical protein